MRMTNRQPTSGRGPVETDPLSIFEVGHRLPDTADDIYTAIRAHGFLWGLPTSLESGCDLLCYDPDCNFLLKYSRTSPIKRVQESRPHTCERAVNLQLQKEHSQKAIDGIKSFTSGSDQWWAEGMRARM